MARRRRRRTRARRRRRIEIADPCSAACGGVSPALVRTQSGLADGAISGAIVIDPLAPPAAWASSAWRWRGRCGCWTPPFSGPRPRPCAGRGRTVRGFSNRLRPGAACMANSWPIYPPPTSSPSPPGPDLNSRGKFVFRSTPPSALPAVRGGNSARNSCSTSSTAGFILPATMTGARPTKGRCAAPKPGRCGS